MSRRLSWLVRLAVILAAAAMPALAFAQGLPGLTASKGPGGAQTWSLSIAS